MAQATSYNLSNDPSRRDARHQGYCPPCGAGKDPDV